MKRTVSVAAAAASIAIFACAGVATASPGGPQPAGPAPAKGVHTLGASNVSGWAVVDATGTLARGANAVAVAVIKLGAGTYEVQMNSKLKHCSFVGSAGDPGQGTSGFGVVTTANRAGNEKAVFVQTFNQAGTSTDTDFHLNVTCS